MGFLDILRPEWQHSDASVRLAAVKQLGAADAEVLAAIVRTDPDAPVREAALARIHDADTLAALLDGDLDEALRPRLRQVLDELRGHQVVETADTAEALRLIAAIETPDILEQIAAEAEAVEIRRAAVARIDAPTRLARLAAANCGRIGPDLIARIGDVALLERIVERGSNKAVQRLAAEKIEELTRPAHEPSPDEERAAELDGLADAAADLAQSWQWDFAAGRLGEIQRRWTELDPDHRHPRVGELTDAVATLATRHEEFENKHREAEAAQARRQARERAQDTFVDLVAAITAGAHDRVAELRIELPPEDDDELTELRDRRRRLLADYDAKRAAWHAEEMRLQELIDLSARARVYANDGRYPDAEELLARVEQTHRREPWKLVDTADALEQVEEVRELIRERRRAERDAERAEILADHDQVEKLCGRLEVLANAGTTTAKIARQAADIAHQWERIADHHPEVVEPYADRFRKARRTLNELRRETREEEEWNRWFNKTVKEELCRKVEALAEDNDLPQVARRIKEAQAKWKEAGPAPRAEEQQLWERFHRVCNEQFARCKVFFDERDRQREENRLAKEDICRRAEELAESTNWREATEGLKDLQVTWKEIGGTHRKAERQLWERFRAACDTFFNRRRENFRERDEAREASRDAKEKLCLEAEEIADAKDWQRAHRMRQLRDEWQNVRPGPRRDENKLWKRFTAALDRYFDWIDNSRDENLAAKEAIVQAAEDLVHGSDGRSEREVADEIKALQAKWKESGPAPREKEQVLWERFQALGNEFFEGLRARYDDRDKQQTDNFRRKERLCTELENLVGAAAPEGDTTTPENRSLSLADELKLAFETNFAIGSQADQGVRNADVRAEVRNLQERWKRIGPVPRQHDRSLWRRWRHALDAFYGNRD